PIGSRSLLLLGSNADVVAVLEMTAEDVAVLAFEVDEVRVGGIDPADEAIAAADHGPVIVDGAGGVQRSRWAAPAAVILHAAVDTVRLSRIHRHMIELAEREVIQ